MYVGREVCMYICAIRICTCTYIHVCVSIARSILQTIHRLRWPLAQQVWHGAGFSPPRSGRCGDFSAGVDRRSAQGPSGRRHRLSRAERCGAEQSGWGKKAGFQECYGDMRIYWKYYIGDMGFRGIIPRRITMCLST